MSNKFFGFQETSHKRTFNSTNRTTKKRRENNKNRTRTLKASCDRAQVSAAASKRLTVKGSSYNRTSTRSMYVHYCFLLLPRPFALWSAYEPPTRPFAHEAGPRRVNPPTAAGRFLLCGRHRRCVSLAKVVHCQVTEIAVLRTPTPGRSVEIEWCI